MKIPFSPPDMTEMEAKEEVTQGQIPVTRERELEQ